MLAIQTKWMGSRRGVARRAGWGSEFGGVGGSGQKAGRMPAHLAPIPLTLAVIARLLAIGFAVCVEREACAVGFQCLIGHEALHRRDRLAHDVGGGFEIAILGMRGGKCIE